LRDRTRAAARPRDLPVGQIAVGLDSERASQVQTDRRHPSQKIEIGDDGAVTSTFRARVCPELETWAAAFGERPTVLRPASLARRSRRGFRERPRRTRF
jgi:hypothetical protein